MTKMQMANTQAAMAAWRKNFRLTLTLRCPFSSLRVTTTACVSSSSASLFAAVSNGLTSKLSSA